MHAPRRLLILTFAFLLAPALYAAGPSPDFTPDPHSYERGYQHGQLLAPEIAAYVRCFAAQQSPKAPTEGWQITRHLVNALFVRRYEKEYLEEMKGIADGATAA